METINYIIGLFESTFGKNDVIATPRRRLRRRSIISDKEYFYDDVHVSLVETDIHHYPYRILCNKNGNSIIEYSLSSDKTLSKESEYIQRFCDKNVVTVNELREFEGIPEKRTNHTYMNRKIPYFTRIQINDMQICGDSYEIDLETNNNPKIKFWTSCPP